MPNGHVLISSDSWGYPSEVACTVKRVDVGWNQISRSLVTLTVISGSSLTLFLILMLTLLTCARSKSIPPHKWTLNGKRWYSTDTSARAREECSYVCVEMYYWLSLHHTFWGSCWSWTEYFERAEWEYCWSWHQKTWFSMSSGSCGFQFFMNKISIPSVLYT